MKAYKRLQAERDTLDETVKVLAIQREPSNASGNQSEDQEDGSPSGKTGGVSPQKPPYSYK